MCVAPPDVTPPAPEPTAPLNVTLDMGYSATEFPDMEYRRLKLACKGEMKWFKGIIEKLGLIQASYDGALGTIMTSGVAAGTIPVARLVKAHTDGTLLVGTLGTRRIVGCNISVEKLVTETVTMGVGYVTCVAAEPLIAGDNVKCGDNGRLLKLADADHLSETVMAAAAGNFANQPTNDGVEIVSSSAADTTQTCTIIGTTTGGTVVVAEDVVLTGTDAVATVKVDWGVVLAVKLSASCAGTVTVREASADATIIALTTGILSKGVTEVTAISQGCHGLIPYTAADGAATAIVGVLYEPATGATDTYMAATLDGTTPVVFGAAANLIKEIYAGDVPTGLVTTVYTCAAEDDEHLKIGRAVATFTAGGSGVAHVRL